MKISIVTPSYNLGQYIEQSIQSVLGQNYDNFEYFVIDGGSTDNTIDILKKYSRDKRHKNKFHWISEPDKGQTDAINKGLKVCTGSWFAWLNADDFYEPNIFSKLAQYLKQFSSAGVIYGNCYTVNKQEGELFRNIPPKNVDFNRLKRGNVIYGPASFYNMKVLQKVGKFDDTLNFWMDYEMYLRISKIMKLQYINLNIANFRIREGKQKATNPKFRRAMKEERGRIQKKYSSWPEIFLVLRMRCLKKLLIKKLKKISLLRFFYKKIRNIILYLAFVKDYKHFRKLSRNDNRFQISWENRRPCLKEKTSYSKFDSHYIYHSAWAARVLAKTKPESHIDISSTLYFCSIVSAFIPVKFYDYRPAQLNLNNLTSKKADLLSLPFPDNSIKSLSCMHTVEHIGLGRYGDPVDPKDDLKAITELKRVLAPGGNLLFVVPIGKPNIIFNAHRIYSYDQIKKYFSELKLQEFSLIPDNADKRGVIKNASKKEADKQNYGCGCFWFIK